MTNEVQEKEVNQNQEHAENYAASLLIANVNEIKEAVEAGIAPLESELRKRIGHVQFREVFLPFFANDPMENRKYPTVTLDTWINGVAGNVFQEVDLIDETTGNVVATVPPIRDREAVLPKDPTGMEGGRERLKAVWEHVSMVRHISHHAAEKQLLEQLQGRLFLDADTERNHIIRYAEEWNKIYEFYGRELPFPAIRNIINGEEVVEAEDDDAQTKQSNDRPLSAVDERGITDAGLEFTFD